MSDILTPKRQPNDPQTLTKNGVGLGLVLGIGLGIGI